MAELPELLTVTATAVVLAATASIKQLAPAVGSGFTILVLPLVQVVPLEWVTSPPELPFTRVAVTVNCWHGVLAGQPLAGVVPSASNTELGLTDMLPTEVGETQKPSQAVKATAKAISPHKGMKIAIRRFMKLSLRS